MNKTLKVLLSCLIGSGIGTFIALSVNSWFWWTGALAGGVIGYLSYEFKNVIDAIPRAWRATINWKPDWEYWKDIPLFFIFLNMIALSLCCFFGLLDLVSPRNIFGVFLGTDMFYSILIAFEVIAFCFSFFLVNSLCGFEIVEYTVIVSPLGISVIVLICIVYPLTLIPLALWRIIRKIPMATKAVGRFLKKLFTLIYSERRLLCSVSSMTGVIAGYFISQAYSLNLLTGVLVGMIAGALLGLAQYQILSVKVFKVALKNGEK